MRHSITYVPNHKITTIEPSFFFLSRATAVNYWLEWKKRMPNFARDGQLWRCEAEYIFRPPLYVPPSNASDLFQIFWRTYYSGTSEQESLRYDIRDIFDGLEPTPYGTVLAFTFSVEQQLRLPNDKE